MKERLDMLLLAQGLAPSRERARSMIMEGVVWVDGMKADKAGQPVSQGASIEVRGTAQPFVSRGGLKLMKAVESFPIRLSGVVALDVGASTGGFTDCMLQRGAKHVYAIDVGYGQLDWKLRNDSRVTVMERTNARFMEKAWFPMEADFASVDVSFISLKLILPPLANSLSDSAAVVALVKPQFEAGRGEVGKNGVIRDAAVHRRVLERVVNEAPQSGLVPESLTFSPITGPKGNIEFLLYLKKGVAGFEMNSLWTERIRQVVDEAHRACI